MYWIRSIIKLKFQLIKYMARGGRRRGGGGGPDYMDLIDAQITAMQEMLFVNSGILTSTGTEIMFQGKSDLIPFDQLQTVTQINLTIAGQKVQAKGTTCHTMTMICGSFFIFPLCFMCCQWYKNIVHPKYAMDVRSYEQIAKLIKSCPAATFLNLAVYDNNITSQKLQILAQAISQSRINRLSLTNNCLESNYQSDQYSNFESNTECIKRLNLKSCHLQWRQKIVPVPMGTGVVGGGSYNQMTEANLQYQFQQPSFNNGLQPNYNSTLNRNNNMAKMG